MNLGKKKRLRKAFHQKKLFQPNQRTTLVSLLVLRLVWRFNMSAWKDIERVLMAALDPNHMLLLMFFLQHQHHRVELLHSLFI